MRRAAAACLLAAGRHAYLAIWAMENMPFLVDQLRMVAAFLS
jgi:hypothetical protein